MLLYQGIVFNIRLRGKVAIVVINLDMNKAYDKVDWNFLIKVLERLGFNSNVTTMIWRILAKYWSSVLINGQAHGFFHSTMGVKKGSPISC